MDTTSTAPRRAVAPGAMPGARRRRLRLPFDPLALVGVLLLVLVWWGASQLVGSTNVPAPLDVFARLSDEFTTSYQMQSFGLQAEGYLGNLGFTVQTVFIAVLGGSLIGIAIGLLSARAPGFRAAIDPVVLVGGTVPVLVATPFFLIWFGTERIVAYLLVGVYSMFTLIVFAHVLRVIDEGLRLLADPAFIGTSIAALGLSLWAVVLLRKK